MDSFFYAGEALLWKNLRWTFVCSFYYGSIYIKKGLPGGSDGKASASNVEDPGSIAGLGRSSEEGNGNPLQYPCLENPMDGGAWQATVCGVTKSRTRLSDFKCKCNT